MARNIFANRSTGAICQVTRVDDSFATLSILTPNPSKFMMPIAEYDLRFATMWRPATEADLEVLEEVGRFRLPTVVPADWS